MCCPDCKDGFYYPLIGPPENCQTCYLPELGQKPQAEDRMHRKTLAESADMEKGYVDRQNRVQPKFIHEYSYTAPSDAELARLLASKQEHADALLQKYDKERHSVRFTEPRIIKETEVQTILQAAIDGHKAKRISLAERDALLERVVIQPSLSGVRTKPMEYANQLKHLMDSQRLTVEVLAEKISKSVVFVKQHLNLLKLPHITQMMVDRGDISLETAILSEVKRRNFNIQGTATCRMESTDLSYH